MNNGPPDPHYTSTPACDLRYWLQLITGYTVEVDPEMTGSGVQIDPGGRVVTFRPGLNLEQFQWGISRVRMAISCGLQWVPELKPLRPRLAVVRDTPARQPAPGVEFHCACCAQSYNRAVTR